MHGGRARRRHDARLAHEPLSAHRERCRMTRPVGYVVSIFPCWSETFILREILALAERDVPIRIFSLKPPRERLVQDEARQLLADVVYPRMLGAFFSVLRRPTRALA